MFKINLKGILINLIIISVIFITDRISKIYILNLAKHDGAININITEYLNFNLIWNKGIAFGIFSFDDMFLYNIISLIIIIINIVILIMIIRTDSFKKYFLLFILGGSLGNVFDRLYFSGVPDFIDFHINNFHWFIFNVADIFITLGVICLIYVEIFFDKGKNEKLI